MIARAFFAVLLGALCGLTACSPPGKPESGVEVPRPDEVLDARILFQQNCAGCHGAEGRLGPAMAIGDPVYLAIVDDDTLRRTISKGRAGTAMSAFAQSEGGMLTARQIDSIIHGIRQRWEKAQSLQGAPSYVAKSAGNAQQGAIAYAKYCASCHGPEGRGEEGAGSIVDASYLSLISDQGLRTIVIVGRPDFNAPDWRGNLPGHPMTDAEITDVVAWLGAQRPKPMVAPSTTSPSRGGNH
jgi:mono/diheme cytochrome c family protein